MKITGDYPDDDYIEGSEYLEVRLDGVKVERFVSADDVFGKIVREVRNEKGELQVDYKKQEIMRESFTGVVEIIWTHPTMTLEDWKKCSALIGADRQRAWNTEQERSRIAYEERCRQRDLEKQGASNVQAN